jgi:hypothetical protein
MAVLGLAGYSCTTTKSDDRSDRFSDRADEALRDPFGYSPSFDKAGVSGGGLRELDKDAMRKDVDSVFNP